MRKSTSFGPTPRWRKCSSTAIPRDLGNPLGELVQRSAGVHRIVDLEDDEVLQRGLQVRLRPGEEHAAFHERPHDAQNVGDVAEPHRTNPAVAVGVHHGARPEIGEGFLEDHPLLPAVEYVHAFDAPGAGAARTVEKLQVGLPAGLAAVKESTSARLKLASRPPGRQE